MKQSERRGIRSNMVAAALAFAGCGGASSPPPSTAYYVNASGSDQFNGTTPTTPFRTLEHALLSARARAGKKTIFIAGPIIRSMPLRLSKADKGIILVSTPGGTGRIISSEGSLAGLIIDHADGVTVANLSFEGFSSDGILVRNSIAVQILGNRVTNTRSTGWSQGAIHLTGTVRSATIRGNSVEGADYAGIIIDTDRASNVSGVAIVGNTVTKACRKIMDCGAIYINDRGRRSSGITISKNIITDFGTSYTAGRAIYLDDWASGATVKQNTISGPGRFAFQIHGGHNNIITDNFINLREIEDVLLVEPAGEGNWQNLSGNIFSKNRVEFGYGQSRPTMWRRTIPSIARPVTDHNQACLGKDCWPLE